MRRSVHIERESCVLTYIYIFVVFIDNLFASFYKLQYGFNIFGKFCVSLVYSCLCKVIQ